jgi:apolipoprotein N-acyltransferase
LFTGLSIASLSHAVVEYPLLIQVASLAGAYAVSFLLMLVAITLATWQTSALRTRSEALMATVVTLFCVAGSLAWGWQSLTPQVAKNEGNERSLRVLLVQGSVDTVLDHDPERPRAMLQHYRDLTSEHLATQPEPYDLIVWPESSLAWPDYLSDDTARPRSGSEVTAEEFRENVKAFQNEQRQLISYLLKDFNRLRFGRTEFLAGTTTVVFSGEQARSYNSALLISPFGEVRSRYYKNHLVMFGEYIPVLDWFPWLYDYTPLPGGLHRGDGPVLFMVNGTTCATSICFESTVPHLLRQHFQELSHKGTPPELLLNLSNDGWFYGSAVLDLHFQCAVFRAVECGRPFLVAANTGISGSIDARGRVLARGPRRATALLPVTAKLTKVTTLYTALGDWPVFLLCWGSLLAALPLRFGRTAAEA